MGRWRDRYCSGVFSNIRRTFHQHQILCKTRLGSANLCLIGQLLQDYRCRDHRPSPSLPVLQSLRPLLRLFSQSRTLRYLVYFGILWASIILLIVLVAEGTLCAPQHDETGVSLTLIMRCRSRMTWGVAQGALNMVLNFYILALPIPFLWRLETGRKKKIGAISVFMTGFI